jgi:phosphoglycerate dehydrogenase-like enzyme
MPKLVLMPPQEERRRSWAARLAAELPRYEVIAPESDAEARRDLPDADAVYGWVSPELLPLAKRLRWLQSPAVAPPPGYFYPALIAHPVVVCNPRGIYDDHIAQHILMFVLALARGLPFYLDAQRHGRWEPDAPQSPYVNLRSATALMVGVGSIGQEAARLCLACGLRVLGVDARWEHAAHGVERHGLGDLDALLPEADFVIVTLPHTPATEGMWDARRFGLMRPTASFINIGRGRTTQLDDLVAALRSGTIAGCALDVFEVEPLPGEHPLWTLPNVLLTPHVAAHHAADLDERQFAILLDNARRFAGGEPLRNMVDKAAWY